jgi:hypothetical protein
VATCEALPVRTYSVVAANGSATSENKIHDDDVARRYGFGGGLVPGVTLYAYLTRPVVETWGRPWLERGEAEVKFVSPVYDGDKVTASLGDDGSLERRDSRGDLCATGSARAPTLGSDAPADIPAAPLPRDRPPADERSLAPGRVLGTVEHRFVADDAGDYLAMIADDLPLYPQDGVAHPGWLLRDANAVLASSVVLGPWIHVSSRIRHFRAVTNGQLLSTRARVASRFERHGNHFVELEVLTLVDGSPALFVHHSAIWQLRPRP